MGEGALASTFLGRPGRTVFARAEPASLRGTGGEGLLTQVGWTVVLAAAATSFYAPDMEAAGASAVCGRGLSAMRGIARPWRLVLVLAVIAMARSAAAAPSDGDGPPRLGSGSAGAGSGSASSVPARPIVAAAPSAECDPASVKQFVSRSEQTFVAGFPAAALALINRALVCKQDDQMYRLAALYACAARNAASAQWSYNRLPASARAPIAQRCQRENITLSEPVVRIARPEPSPPPPSPPPPVTIRVSAPPPAAPSGPASRCDALVDEAATRFADGAAGSALALYEQAMSCKRDALMIPLAAVYACVARNAASADRYYRSSSSIFHAAIRQRCQQEGIALPVPSSGTPSP
jgi:hypothetical protein